jgi:ribose transport system substrate-binding protein
VNRRITLLIVAAIIVAAVVIILSRTISRQQADSLQSQEQGRETKGVIGLSVLTLVNPGFRMMADAMEAEAAKYGYELILESGDLDPAKQKDQIENFIVQKVDAIVLCPCDSITIGTAIKEANKAGIPVFTADIACLADGAKVVCHVAADNYGGGRQAGKAIIEAIGGSGKAAIVDHPEVESVILRTKGFEDELAQAKLEKGVDIQIVARVAGHGEQAESFKAAEDILQGHPDLNAIFAINDPTALGVIAAIEKAGLASQVKVVGFDGFLMGRKEIKEGRMYAEPVQHLDEIGRKTAELIAKYMEGEEVPAEFLIPTTLYRKEDADKDPELK